MVLKWKLAKDLKPRNSQNGDGANGMAWFTCEKKDTKVIKSKTSLVTWNPQESLSWHKTIQKKKEQVKIVDYSDNHSQRWLLLYSQLADVDKIGTISKVS